MPETSAAIAAPPSQADRKRLENRQPLRRSCWERGQALSLGRCSSTVCAVLGIRGDAVRWRCWQNHTPYEDQIYEAALRKHGSPLVALFDKVELEKPAEKSGE